MRNLIGGICLMNKVLLVYNKFEQEFQRLLTPMEKEIINDWREKNTDETIIKALKEAVYSNALSLRYIAKILDRWQNEDSPAPEFDTSWLD